MFTSRPRPDAARRPSLHTSGVVMLRGHQLCEPIWKEFEFSLSMNTDERRHPTLSLILESSTEI
jgi:hypothetical protein